MIPFVIFLTVLIYRGQAADEGRTQVYSYEGEITFVHLEDENEEVPIAKVSFVLGVLHNCSVPKDYFNYLSIAYAQC